MARYIHNVSLDQEYYLGTPVAAGAFFLIPNDKEIAYANDDKVISDITSGAIAISKDGVNDISEGVNSQINYLKGLNQVSEVIIKGVDTTDVLATSGNATSQAELFISNKLKCVFSDDDTSLSSTHTDVFTKTGSGLIYSFALEFSSNRVALRFEVDGQEVFDYKLKEEIEEFAKFMAVTKSDGSNDAFFHLGSSDRVLFKPPFPIKYNTSFKIQAKETSGNRTVDWHNVYYTDES